MAVKNVTIYDIAAEAGVSPATVSRVLTGSANVRQDKKSRIEELIQNFEKLSDIYPDIYDRFKDDFDEEDIDY